MQVSGLNFRASDIHLFCATRGMCYATTVVGMYGQPWLLQYFFPLGLFFLFRLSFLGSVVTCICVTTMWVHACTIGISLCRFPSSSSFPITFISGFWMRSGFLFHDQLQLIDRLEEMFANIFMHEIRDTISPYMLQSMRCVLDEWRHRMLSLSLTEPADWSRDTAEILTDDVPVPMPNDIVMGC